MALSFHLAYKATEKSRGKVEQALYIILAIINSIMLIIYYVDRFNIPTELDWATNVNTQNWLNFISTYFSTGINTGIAALVSVLVTKYQIKKNNEDNEKRDKENLRIQNMPMLKYEITTKGINDNNKVERDDIIISNCEEKDTMTYEISI